MSHTYSVHLTDAGTPAPGIYDRDDGVQVMSDDADLVAWLATGNVPPVPTFVPKTIAAWQFWQQIATLGMLSEDDALAAANHTIPAVMQPVIAALPAAQQFAARMRLTSATEFRRDDPLVAVFAAAQTPALTSAQVDAIWIAASQL